MRLRVDFGYNGTDFSGWAAQPGRRTVEEVLAGARSVLVLEDLVDHTNVGAIFRSAAAFGVDAVLVTTRERAQDVKQVVEQLKLTGREDLT